MARLKILVTLMLTFCAAAHGASLDEAKELLEEAREELEAVIVAADSTPSERAEALALVRRLDGGSAAAPPTPAPVSGRLVDNGDGTGTDPVTGLTWVLKDNGAPIPFEAAKSNCAGSRRGGHTDWRLPTWADLGSLVLDELHGEFRVSPLLKLSSCTPWIVQDDLEDPYGMERDLCDGGGMIVNKYKRAPALCVRGQRIP